MKYVTWSVLIVIIAAIVVGVAIIGSPQNQRAQRFDQQRVSDLQNIQWQIISYWQTKRVLPTDFGNLKNDINGYAVPVDPETGVSYEYTTTGETAFTLCATFKTKSSGSQSKYGPTPIGEAVDSWNHDAGRVCFDRTFDKAMYPPPTPKQ